ncbi:MAG: nucleotide excision repair endonuclease [Verrucomicrobia bacterium]|nr:nucleotide excision repair endonuclease [Verrucomicrobiota bacterium]
MSGGNHIIGPNPLKEKAAVAHRKKSRQLRLFELCNPFIQRLGADFFKSLPACPGVYFFYDSTGRLIYIGQSNTLRARVGSYRHVGPERYPRRILRLVNRIARIEWRECGTPDEAIELERVLLLKHRPQYNRAGVWPGAPWWLTVYEWKDGVQARLSRHPAEHPSCTGPLPPSFRYAYSSLLRCTLHLLNPDRKLSDYPLGMLKATAPLTFQFKTTGASGIAAALKDCASGNAGAYLLHLESGSVSKTALEQGFWDEQIQSLRRYFAKKRVPTLQQALPPTSPLPLFPDL